MIQVLEHGMWIKRSECPNCGCKFLYNTKMTNNGGDVRSNWDSHIYDLDFDDCDCSSIPERKYVSCPECSNVIWLDK